MEPLYTITNKPNLDEYIRFGRVVFDKQYRLRKKSLIVNILYSIIICSCLMAYCFGHVSITYLYVGTALFVALLYFNWSRSYRTKRQLKKSFQTNKLNAAEDNEYQVLFFEDSFKVTSNYGESSLEYAKLFQILETPTHFYLMSGQGHGTIVPKVGSSEDFFNFIRKIRAKHRL